MAARGVASKGAGGARCELTAAQLRELEMVLDAGPAASGWAEDQCWTLAGMAGVIAARFGVEYTLAGADLLLQPAALVGSSVIAEYSPPLLRREAVVEHSTRGTEHQWAS